MILKFLLIKCGRKKLKKCYSSLKTTSITSRLCRKKILNELDKLWSLYVRHRDNKCMLCGGYVGQPEKLQAHHWIIPRGKSLKYRFDPRNGIALCYGCHIHQVHTNPTVDIINRVRESALSNHIVTLDDIEEIVNSSRSVNKITTVELQEKLEDLKNLLTYR